jgi:CrcB protein
MLVAACSSPPDGRLAVEPQTRPFVIVGLCGGYTTFSAFSLQTLSLMQEGAWGLASIYIVASVLLCVLAVWVGHVLAAQLGV